MPKEMEARQCEACGVWTYNLEHTCVSYDGPPCQTCGQPTVFYTVGAPGTGSGRVCPDGHDEPVVRTRILTIAEVV